MTNHHIERRVSVAGLLAIAWRAIGAGAAVVLLQATVLWGQSGMQIVGKVRAEGGEAVVGARVTAVGEFQPGGGARAALSTISGADGGFTLGPAVAGKYVVCAQMPGTVLLNACQWSPDEALRVTVTAKAGVAGAVITMKRGARLEIAIADPAQALKSVTGGIRKAGLSVGIWSLRGLFNPVPLVTETPAGATYAMAVPVASTLRLAFSSQKIALTDDKGVAVRQNQDHASFQVGRTELVKRFQFTIMGVSK